MKNKIWILIVVFVLLASVAAGAAYVYYVTSNVNRYRPLLERKLTEALGNPVRMSLIDMSWSGGLTAEAMDVVVLESGKSVIKMRKAAMKLDPWALLFRRLVIRSIEIVEPQMTVRQRADGTVAVVGVNPAAEGAPGPAASAAAGAGSLGAWSLLIENVRIKNAQLTFVDESTSPPLWTVIRRLDADIRDISLDGPVTAEAQAAVFGNDQNVKVSAKASALRSGHPKIENVDIKIQLNLMDMAQAARLFPAIVPYLDGPVGGQVTLKIPSLALGGGSSEFLAEGELAGGSARVRNLRPKIDRLDAKLTVTHQTASVESAAIDLAGGQIQIKGGVRDYRKAGSAVSQLDVKAKGLKIENFLERDSSAKTMLEGEMGGSFVGTAVGLDDASIRRTLGGKVAVDFPDGILLNLNLVREILGKLATMFPGIIEAVEARLPEAYRTQLTSRSTILKPLHHEFEVRDGALLVRGLSVATDFFSATMQGDLKLTGTFEGRGTIQLDNTFSNALFDGVPQLQPLANAASLVELPLIIRYRNAKLSVLPDLQEIGRRLVQGTGQKLLSKLLSGVSAAAAPPSAAAETAPASAGGNTPQ